MACLLLPMAPLALEQPPIWVEKIPSNPDQYIGIGHADKASHPTNYREAAQAMALAQISREISIQIHSENVLTQSEQGKDWTEAYSQKVRTASQNDLSGYQLEKIYETGTGFWAFYSLDKDVYQKALDRKEQVFVDWLEGEVGGLNYDLDSRQIQHAVDRYGKIRLAYTKRYASESMLLGNHENSSRLYSTVTAKMQHALRKTELVSSAEPWVVSFTDFKSLKSAYPSRVSLADLATGTNWSGPLTLNISNRLSQNKFPCQVETDGQGMVDLAHIFIDCKIAPGRWTIHWVGPDDSLRFERMAQWRPIELTLEFLKEGSTITKEMLSQFQLEMASQSSPYYRIVSANKQSPMQVRLPKLEIRLQEMTEDSLDGMYFCAIRGNVLWPEKPTQYAVIGKAGHSNKDRARSKAIQDMVKSIDPFKLFAISGSAR